MRKRVPALVLSSALVLGSVPAVPQVAWAEEATISTSDSQTAQTIPLKFLANGELITSHAKPISVTWNEDYFRQDNTVYNHDLAIFGCIMAADMYALSPSGEGLLHNSNGSLSLGDLSSLSDKELKPQPLHENLDHLGFTGAKDYQYVNLIVNEDPIGHTFAVKRLADGTDLVFIALRGTSTQAEWASNFNVSNTTEKAETFHEGFKNTADNVLNDLADYLKDYKGEDGKSVDLSQARFFVCGHSRGAAATQLVAYGLNQGWHAEGVQGTVDQANVYAYAYAPPTVVQASENLSASNQNIMNIVNPEDIVPEVPVKPWGYVRIGQDFVLPSPSNLSEEPYAARREQVNTMYKTWTDGKEHVSYRTGAQPVRNFRATIGSYAPTVTDAYKVGVPYSDGSAATVIDSVKALLFKVNGFDYTSEKVSTQMVNELMANLGIDSSDTTAKTAGKEVLQAHLLQTYLGFMLAQSDSASPYITQNYHTVSVAKAGGDADGSLAGVTLTVNNASGKVSALLNDGAVDENTVLPLSVKAGTATVDLPGDATYSLSLTAPTNEAFTVTCRELTPQGDVVSETEKTIVPGVAGQQATMEANTAGSSIAFLEQQSALQKRLAELCAVSLEDHDYWYDLGAEVNERDEAGNLVPRWYVIRAGEVRKNCWVDYHGRGNWYYLGEDGEMLTGKQYLEFGGKSEWYYLNPYHDGTYGAMRHGWICVDGDWYYCDPVQGSGSYGKIMRNTTLTIDGKSYTFNSEGVCVNP